MPQRARSSDTERTELIPTGFYTKARKSRDRDVGARLDRARPGELDEAAGTPILRRDLCVGTLRSLWRNSGLFPSASSFDFRAGLFVSSVVSIQFSRIENGLAVEPRF